MDISNIKDSLIIKINELKNKYDLLNFYNGFFDEIFDASINNLNENDISNLEFNFVMNFKKNLGNYINENFDELKDRCFDVISKDDVKQFIKFCTCLDSLNYDNIDLAKYFLENENTLFNNLMNKTLNSNIAKDSNNLSIFMAEYYSNKDEYQVEEFDKLISEYTSSIDNYNSTGMYLKEIAKYKLLTHEEEIELFKDYKENGNEKAREKIINSNLRLSVSIAKRYSSKAKSLSLLDLAMEGNTGLMKAVDRFDYKKNLKFSTYATWWVYQSITRAIVEKDRTVRQPEHMDVKIKKLKKTVFKFEENNGRLPSIEELSDILGEKEEKIKKYYEYFKQYDIISLNQYINDEEKNELGDFIPDKVTVEDEVQKNIDKDELIKLFKYASLNERQVQIISLRYGIINGRKMSLQEIGDTLGLTRERVRQVEEKSLKKLYNAKKMLDNTEIYNQNLHGIYFLYKDNYYSKDQIDSAIRRMSNLSIKILKKKFGNDYTNNFSSKELSICEEKIFERTINKDIPNAIKHPIYKQDKLLFVLSEIFSEYNFLEVKGAILLLEKNYIKYLYQICGDDLYKQFDLSLMNTDTFSIFNTILQEIKKYLPEKKKIIKQVLNVDNSQTYDAFKNIKVTQGKTNVSKNKSLYKYFEEYSKSEVDDAISRLKNDYYEFLLKIYNNGLDDNYNPNITPSDHTKLTVVKRQLKQLLELKDLSFRKKEEPLITKIFMEYEKDYIIYAINRLDKNQKAFIISVLGNDLENTKTNLSKEDTAKFNSICRNIKKILSKDSDFYINIYAYFNDYEIDDVNEAIKSLNKINLSILMHNCGKNYLKSFELKKDLESNKEFLHVLDLIRKNINNKKQSQNNINQKRKNKRYQSIYEKYKSCTKEEVDDAISRLTPANKKIVILMNGSDLSNPVISSSVNASTRNRYSVIINKMLPKLLCDDSDIKIYNKGDKIFQTDVILDEEVFDDKNDDIDLNYINNIINTTSFKKALDGFSEVEKQAIILNITKKYSIDTLSKIFKISTDSIVSITKEALYNFKENIISSFDIIQKKYTKK